jgi:REP element-mobilizing transposase RayT
MAWCLMPNHFHLLVRINLGDDILPEQAATYATQKFSNALNAYVQAYNKQWKRRGSLLMRSFRRKQITDDIYLKNVICYIHNNPAHHGFKTSPADWQYSSYSEIVEHPENFTGMINLFGGLEHFRVYHHGFPKVNPLLDEFMPTS